VLNLTTQKTRIICMVLIFICTFTYLVAIVAESSMSPVSFTIRSFREIEGTRGVEQVESPAIAKTNIELLNSTEDYRDSFSEYLHICSLNLTQLTVKATVTAQSSIEVLLSYYFRDYDKVPSIRDTISWANMTTGDTRILHFPIPVEQIKSNLTDIIVFSRLSISCVGGRGSIDHVVLEGTYDTPVQEAILDVQDTEGERVHTSPYFNEIETWVPTLNISSSTSSDFGVFEIYRSNETIFLPVNEYSIICGWKYRTADFSDTTSANVTVDSDHSSRWEIRILSRRIYVSINTPTSIVSVDLDYASFYPWPKRGDFIYLPFDYDFLIRVTVQFLYQDFGHFQEYFHASSAEEDFVLDIEVPFIQIGGVVGPPLIFAYLFLVFTIAFCVMTELYQYLAKNNQDILKNPRCIGIILFNLSLFLPWGIDFSDYYWNDYVYIISIFRAWGLCSVCADGAPVFISGYSAIYRGTYFTIASNIAFIYFWGTFVYVIYSIWNSKGRVTDSTITAVIFSVIIEVAMALYQTQPSYRVYSEVGLGELILLFLWSYSGFLVIAIPVSIWHIVNITRKWRNKRHPETIDEIPSNT
jgi:hypothetical protein